MKNTVPSKIPSKGGPSPRSDAWKFAAAGVIVACPAGYFLRNAGKEKEASVKELQTQALRERTKEKREELQMERARLEETAGRQLSIGTSLMLLSVGAALAIGLLGMGVRARRAVLALAPFMLISAVYSVYEAGIVSMVVSSLAGVALIYYATGEPDRRHDVEFREFRRYPVRRELMRELTPGYLSLSVRELSLQVETQKLLRQVDAMPTALARILPRIGEGQPFGFLQLKRDLAYVAFVEANDVSDTHYVSVVMALEEPAPSFVARPLPVVDGVRVPNNGIRFTDDPEFTAEYLVQPEGSADVRAVRALLAPVVRDELRTLPSAWLHVSGNVMALTVYGRFNNDLVDHLVDVADVLFAELGAAGGPSLLEPDDALVVGDEVVVKRKKKKRKAAKPEGPEASAGA
ncbi:MAG: hypothetical protein IPM79_31445 [Polyangiaceae bacterium]|nr:hypothetical protein [Polyangiaceae bacterium]MBK8941998.1 hypothetical protein [Polyangiaceae bacterium]